MKKFLVDVNLPYYFSLWNHDEYVHQMDLGDDWDDERIWNYAKANNLTIISKDSDFSTRIMFREPPPKVIHIRIGNLKMNDFFNVMTKVWEDVLSLNNECKLINVFIDRIEGIN
ncbi:MAG: DUF5615 family PIN-like protein [Bacteroidota bacterium]